MPKYDDNGNRIYGGAEAKYLKRTAKQRARRNKARRMLEAEGRVHKGDGREVDHKTPLSKGGGDGKGNLQVVSRGSNRASYNKSK